MKETTSLARSQILRMLQVSPLFSPGGKAMKLAPSKIAHQIATFILTRLAEGKEVRFPSLGTFYAKKLKVKVPRDIRVEAYDEPKWEMEEMERIVIRFRPYDSAKYRLRMLVKEGS